MPIYRQTVCPEASCLLALFDQCTAIPTYRQTVCPGASCLLVLYGLLYRYTDILTYRQTVCPGASCLLVLYGLLYRYADIPPYCVSRGLVSAGALWPVVSLCRYTAILCALVSRVCWSFMACSVTMPIYRHTVFGPSACRCFTDISTVTLTYSHNVCLGASCRLLL